MSPEVCGSDCEKQNGKIEVSFGHVARLEKAKKEEGTHEWEQREAEDCCSPIWEEGVVCWDSRRVEGRKSRRKDKWVK